MPEVGRILVVEDDEAQRKLLVAVLQADGWATFEASSGDAAIELLEKGGEIDIVLSDLMMPGMSGVEVTRAIRQHSATPVLVLSVREHERSKVEALDAGADDYITKPFGIQELLARVRAHLRRAPERTASAIEAGDFVIDSSAHTVALLGKLIHLTQKEFDLLLHLARHAGKVITHRALLTAVWGAQSAHQPEYLRVFVGQLRKKIEPDPDEPRVIVTVHGVGYRHRPK